MTEFVTLVRDSAPVYLPILAAIATIVFTKSYVYKGMVPESVIAAQKDMIPENILTAQVERERQLLREQVDRERQLVAAQKDVFTSLEEIVRQLESLTRQVSEQIGQNTDRLRSLEMFMSDFLTQFTELNHNFEKHRKGVPDTEVFRKERA